jgi:hypothetical protein
MSWNVPATYTAFSIRNTVFLRVIMKYRNGFPRSRKIQESILQGSEIKKQSSSSNYLP